MTRPENGKLTDRQMHWVAILCPIALVLAAASFAWTVSVSNQLSDMEVLVENATQDVRELRRELGECCPRSRPKGGPRP